jgi:hypothetical protein
MNEANGCVKLPILTEDGELDPVLNGAEFITKDNAPAPGHRCHDCGALPGHYHHAWCDWEECPRCHERVFSCDCILEDEEEQPDEPEA